MSLIFIVIILGLPALLSWPLGKAMTWALEPPAHPGRSRDHLEFLLRKIGGSGISEDQDWKKYCLSMLFFNAAMFGIVFLLLSVQQFLPLNPDGKGKLSLDLVFHTAASFTTNTNLQHYSGEVSLSYFSQVFGLMWLQFVSAGTGIAALAALARGLAGKRKLGNFYRDLLRATFLVLLPLAVSLAVMLVLAGVPMTFRGAVAVKTLEGAFQIISRGPAAAFVAVKQLGTNGGGFFGANSAHPFENPTFLTNMIECMSILLIPMACVRMFGRITKRKKHAGVIFAVMMVLLVLLVGFAVHSESSPTKALQGLAVEKAAENMEGKELRFGSTAGPLWAAVTTASSNGSVNCMHNSLNPLTSLAPLSGMWLNVAFGGAGVGFINLFLYIIVGVFICGMMVGRTPEYMSRKVETREMKLALLALLLHPLLILGGTSLFALTPWGVDTIKNPGACGFTEILYEFSSAAANNGSGFEGLADNTVPWNIASGIVMLLARFIPIILPLAIAGFLAEKKPAPESIGSLRIDTPLFGLIILSTVVFIGALLFLPVAVLGPIAEHLVSFGGR